MNEQPTVISYESIDGDCKAITLEVFSDGSIMINGIELEPSTMVHLGRTLIENAHKQINGRDK